jgi:hypothetical protein
MSKHKYFNEILAFISGKEVKYSWGNLVSWKPVTNINQFDSDEPTLTFYIEPLSVPQPKQPKYLYVYADGKFFIHSRSPIGAPAHWQYFGKIEVQDD